MMIRAVKTIPFVFTILFLFTSPAVADAGIPMIFFGLPFAIFVLIPVILIECFTYSKRLKIEFKITIKPVATSNLVSTLLGYPLSWLILLALELATTWGFPPNISGVIGKITAVTLQAAWLMPFESELHWMIPIAGLVGLIPAFFLSVFIEKWILQKYFWSDLPNLGTANWRANVYSYLLLVLILLTVLINRLGG
jgi:hypothetical protein